ncbi:MAG: hypothetical protein IID30_15985, partial [Planctomycetes bacterium]|nr:hypothetical protein [Planctomycetota bacterium]
FAFLSVLDYSQPAQVLKVGAIPMGDVAALLAMGTVSWIIGGEIIARRNICTT